MKKILVAVLMILITISFCACKEDKQDKQDNKNTFVKGNLLFDIGAESFEDVAKGEILCGCEEEHNDVIIENIDDLKFLCNYNYTSEYHADEVHELLLYPNNFIVITVADKNYRFRLLEDGSLVSVGSGLAYKIYQADETYRLTPEKFDELHSKYK